tara:strand:- start:1303 stop:2355 length:1053 start_codon:yes stop_codon:yes gene_type:complete
MAIIKMIKNKALPIILVMAIVVFTMGVIAQDDLISSSSNTEFHVFFQNPECVIVNSENRLSYSKYSLGQSLWVSFDGNLPEDSKDICFKEDAAEGVQKCCPLNFDCVGHNNENNKGECVSNVAITCGDYESKGACDDDSNPLVAHNDLNPRLEDDGYGANACTDYYGSYEGSSSCYEFFDCKCEWDEEKEVCESNSNHQIKHIDNENVERIYDHDNKPDNINDICEIGDGSEDDDDDGLGVGNCAIKYTIVGDCSTGDDFVTRSWTADFQNGAQDPFCDSDSDCSSFGQDYFCKGVSGPGICVPGYCKPGSEVIPCERVVRLPFFSLQNIIIAIILLVIIYYFILKKKKK